MINKIFGIIVGVFLLTGSITIAENIERNSTISSTKEISNVSFDDDTPIWAFDNFWNFKIDNMTIDFEQEGQYIHMTLETNKLELNVNEITTDSYILNLDATITGSGIADIDIGDGPINLTLDLKETKLTGTIVFNKSDLGIKQLNPKLVGQLLINIIDQPYIENLPISKISIRATIDVSTSLSIPLTIIDFPINVSNIWGIPGINISLEGTIKSPWLRLVNFINKLASRPLPWRLLMIIASSQGIDEQTLKNISDIIKDVLPVINISYVLEEYLKIGNVFEIPEIPDILLCENLSEITVQGNPYNAYNISVIGGLGNIYYAPEAGNIVKISGNLKDIIPFVSDLNMELINTNYQP